METTMRKCVLAAAGAAALCGGVHAQTNAELKATLDQATRTIQELQDRVRALEGKQQQQQAAGEERARALEAQQQQLQQHQQQQQAAGAPVGAPNVSAEAG